MSRNTIYSVLLAGILAVPLNSAEPPSLVRFSYVEPHMGTTFRLILYAPDQTTADKAAKGAFARIVALDRILSDYKPDSELMRLCKQAGGGPVAVGPELFYVLERAQEVARRSEGAFDVTVGPLSRLWRRCRKIHVLPDAEDLAKAKALVGYQKVVLDAGKRTVELRQPGMILDLGGIAKGYTADEVHKVLKQHGVTRALVAAGGDVTVSDPPADAAAWKVAIAPLEPGEKPSRFLLLKNGSVSTSGDAEQYVEVDGKRYSHLLDPHTGIGLLGRLSATVVAPDGITADSLTKVVAVLGPEKGIPLVEETPGVAALLIRKTDAATAVHASKRFEKLVHHE